MRAMRRLEANGLDVLLASAVILAVASPMLFTHSGFQVDFTNHLWLVWVAGKALVQAGHPTYFLNTTTQGVFNPWFAFYGGTLYMVTGGISELLGGHPVIAYVGVTMIAIAGAYVGTLWLGRQFGLRRWLAHAPALTVASSAYYITDLYGRGAWPEFIAASSIAPLIASGVYLIRAPAWRPWPVLVFVVSTVAFTGSHNITLLWGATIAVMALLILWLGMGLPRQLPYRRLAMVVGLGIIATLVNAWFLLTDIAHAGDVGVGATPSSAAASAAVANGTSFCDTPAVLLDPLRHAVAAANSPGLFVQAPVWFLVWGLLAGILLLRRRAAGRGLRRAWASATIVTVLLLAMIMLKPFWEHLPTPWTEIQFPYRLNAFVIYAVAGLVLVGALALRRAATEHPQRAIRPLRLALIAVMVISLGLCVWQAWVPKFAFFKDRREALVSAYVPPRSWYDGGSYLDRRAPVVPVSPARTLTIPAERVEGDQFAGLVSVPSGPQPIQTNIAAGDYLVRIVGLQWLGRTPSGYAVVRRPNGGSGPVHVVVETASSRAIELGRLLSVLALFAVLAVLIATGARAYRDTRSTRAVPSPLT